MGGNGQGSLRSLPQASAARSHHHQSNCHPHAHPPSLGAPAPLSRTQWGTGPAKQSISASSDGGSRVVVRGSNSEDASFERSASKHGSSSRSSPDGVEGFLGMPSTTMCSQMHAMLDRVSRERWNKRAPPARHISAASAADKQPTRQRHNIHWSRDPHRGPVDVLLERSATELITYLRFKRLLQPEVGWAGAVKGSVAAVLGAQSSPAAQAFMPARPACMRCAQISTAAYCFSGEPALLHERQEVKVELPPRQARPPLPDPAFAAFSCHTSSAPNPG